MKVYEQDNTVILEDIKDFNQSTYLNVVSVLDGLKKMMNHIQV